MGRWWACALAISNFVDFMLTCSESSQYTVCCILLAHCTVYDIHWLPYMHTTKIYGMNIGSDSCFDFRGCSQAAVYFLLHSAESSREHVHAMPHRLLSSISRLLAFLQINRSTVQVTVSTIAWMVHPSESCICCTDV